MVSTLSTKLKVFYYPLGILTRRLMFGIETASRACIILKVKGQKLPHIFAFRLKT